MQLPKEENPFLGWRTSEFVLRDRNFKHNLEGLLKSIYIKIMLPMIMDITEM